MPGVYRPTFQNKRLGGTPNASPGNAGFIGPTCCPYSSPNTLGCRFFDPSNAGVFRLSESFCGTQNGCAAGTVDCCGFLFCITATKRWFVSPFDAEVVRNFYQQNQAATQSCQSYGNLGWFITNPGFAWSCRQYFDAYTNGRYWNQGQESVDRAQTFNYANGNQNSGHNNNKWNGYYQRAFRCADI